MWNRSRVANLSAIAAVMMISLVDESWAEECGKVIAKETIHEITQPVRLEDLTSMYGVACPTFGMARWYRLDNGNHVWFWPVKPSKKQRKRMNIEKYKLLMATEVMEGEEEDQVVLWPASLIGKDFKEVLQKNWK